MPKYHQRLKCLFGRFILYILSLVFKFDNWHTGASVSCRKYKTQLISKINNINENNKFNVLVEIGCGLGDILNGVNANQKYGFDLDEGVIMAAKFLHKDIAFSNGSFSDVVKIYEKQIDLLILVNWIHNVDSHNIIKEITKILAEKEVKFILVDEILYGTKGYKYFHNFNNVFDGYETHTLFLDIEGIRNFRILMKVTNA